MGQRVDLHRKFEIALGSKNVYFQPPESVKLKYPCIIYGLSKLPIKHADDSTDELGKKAFQAGQESKTFKDAIDATKDAVSSQWMKTFELLFGNLEEAVSLWTKVTDILWEVFAASGVARNELLQVWHDSGGRSSLLNAFRNLYDIIEAISEIASSAFHSIIPPMTAERLLALTKGFEAFTFRLKEVIGFVTDFKDSVTNTVAEIINGDPGETIEDAVLTTAAKADAEKAKSV